MVQHSTDCKLKVLLKHSEVSCEKGWKANYKALSLYPSEDKELSQTILGLTYSSKELKYIWSGAYNTKAICSERRNSKKGKKKKRKKKQQQNQIKTKTLLAKVISL